MKNQTGPSLLIATCLIVAIRTAKRPPRADPLPSEQDLNNEIELTIQTANRVLTSLVTKYETIFPQKKEPSIRRMMRTSQNEIEAKRRSLHRRLWAHLLVITKMCERDGIESAHVKNHCKGVGHAVVVINHENSA